MNTLTLVVLMTCAQTNLDDSQPLELWPPNIGQYVHESLHTKARLGYTRQQLSSFPGYTHRLGYVSRLFNDVESLPHETNQFALRMLNGGYEKATASGMRILGAKIEPVTVDEDSEVAIEPVDEEAQQVWESLPEEVHSAVQHLARGATAARPHLHKAFDWDTLARSTGDANISNLGNSRIFNHAAAPWLGSGGWGGSSFSALNTFQATPLGNAGANVFASVRMAINRLLAIDKEAELIDFEICRLKTGVGTVAILGRGNNTYQGTDAIVIDLGGNDRYSGRLAVPVSKNSPVGLLIDLGGNDIYDGRRAPASIACGLFGIGALFDLGGHDKYYCDSSGLGCAWHGIGLLLDTVGNDVYSGRQWTQGAAHAGLGMLIDEAGDDQYFCQLESQGLGATLGVGVLIDKEGKDR